MQSPRKLTAPNTAVFPPAECRRRIEDVGAQQDEYGQPSPRHTPVLRRVIRAYRDGEYISRDREYQAPESMPSVTVHRRDGQVYDRRPPYEERCQPNDDISEPYYEQEQPQLRYDPRFEEQYYDPPVGRPSNYAPYSPRYQHESRQPLVYSPRSQAEYDGQLENRSPRNYMSPNSTSYELETRVSTSDYPPASPRSMDRQSPSREPKESLVKPLTRTYMRRNAMYRAISPEYSEISTLTEDGPAIDYMVPAPRPQSMQAGNAPMRITDAKDYDPIVRDHREQTYSTDQHRPIRRVPRDALPRNSYAVGRYSGRRADSPRNQPATQQALETAASTRRVVSAPAAIIVHPSHQAIARDNNMEQPGAGRNLQNDTPVGGVLLRNGVPHVVTKFGTLRAVVQPPTRLIRQVSVQNNTRDQGCLDTAVKRNICVGSPRSAASVSGTSTAASPKNHDYLQATRSDAMRDNASPTHANVGSGGQQSNHEQSTAGKQGTNAHHTSELDRAPHHSVTSPSADQSRGDQTYNKAGSSYRRPDRSPARRGSSKTNHSEDPAGTNFAWMMPFGRAWRTVATIGLTIIGALIYTMISED